MFIRDLIYVFVNYDIIIRYFNVYIKHIYIRYTTYIMTI